MTGGVHPPGGDVKTRPAGERGALIVLLAAAIELAVFLRLCSLGREAFLKIVVATDTASYVNVTTSLINSGTVPLDAIRTLGYPLFLFPSFLVGGQGYGYHVAVAVQLALNLLLLGGFWRLLSRVAGHTSLAVRWIMAAVFFWAALGMAIPLLSDFLAALLFGVFLYGMLFKRTWGWVVLAGAALGLATLTRPTFTWFPVLLPILALLVRRFTTKVPWAHVALYVACSVAASGLSFAQEYRSRDLVGTDSFTTSFIRVILRRENLPMSFADYKETFQEQIAARAGKPYEELTRSEKDRLAKGLLIDAVRANPRKFAVSWAIGFLKYTFVPIEQGLLSVAGAHEDNGPYASSAARAVLFVLCLPLWLLSLIPPLGARKMYWPYYLAVLIVMGYVLGLSAVKSGAGERIRFAFLAFMLAMAALNLDAVVRWVRDRIGAPRAGAA